MKDAEGPIPIRHRIEETALRLIVLPLGPLGWRGAGAIGAALGAFAWRFVRIRRRVARENLARAFPDLPAREIERIGLAAYRNLGRTFFEFARFGSATQEEVRRIVRFERTDLLDDALAEGRGAILSTGHFGNFDLFGAAVAAAGYPIDVLVQRQSNRAVDERVSRWRARMGARVIVRGPGSRALLRSLRQNRFVAIVADQDARESGVFVDFLGTPASTPRGPAVLAHRTGAPILFGTLKRLPGGTHLARFEGPIRADRERGEEEEVRRITALLAEKLGDAIRDAPEQYFWPHRRWKTPPPQEEEDGGEGN
ncbi:MAG: lysophospholipid acyltransferase family protein [Candidatus Eisenbacteria bacterium]|nr:lysophospholipid acyltransferase family protein [Candidatus Eisenbacteria bacterium]